MRFRIATLLYLIALIAVSFAMCGTRGLVAAAIVLGFWATLRARPAWEFNPLVAGVLSIVVLAIVFLPPAYLSARSVARRSTCASMMKMTALHASSYLATNGKLPPAIVYSDSGQPLHSWRTLILPWMYYDSPYFEQVDLNEPWDGPSNRSICTDAMLDNLNCPAHRAPPARTFYHAVVDDRTVWSGNVESLGRLPDGARHTILLMEANLGAQWAEPRDLTFNEAIDLLTGVTDWADGHGHLVPNGYFFHPHHSLTITMADCSTAILNTPLSREQAEAVLTYKGGEEFDIDDFTGPATLRLDYFRVAAFTTFCLLSLAPARWVFRKRADA